MKSQTDEKKLIKNQSNAAKPRFKIEKLEERVAPRGCHYGHYNPHGKLVGYHCIRHR